MKDVVDGGRRNDQKKKTTLAQPTLRLKRLLTPPNNIAWIHGAGRTYIHSPLVERRPGPRMTLGLTLREKMTKTSAWQKSDEAKSRYPLSKISQTTIGQQI